jgi:VIT1/CCC1 family predicted Fe2+/Mn2+ transporter
LLQADSRDERHGLAALSRQPAGGDRRRRRLSRTGLERDRSQARRGVSPARRRRGGDTALDTLAREELGIDPEELGGSAWQAGASSFLLFSLGTIVPVAPFFFLTGSAAFVTSLAAGAAALMAIGVGTSLFTGRSMVFSALRQLLIGAAAAGITYGVGKVVGVSLG